MLARIGENGLHVSALQYLAVAFAGCYVYTRTRHRESLAEIRSDFVESGWTGRAFHAPHIFEKSRNVGVFFYDARESVGARRLREVAKLYSLAEFFPA